MKKLLIILFTAFTLLPVSMLTASAKTYERGWSGDSSKSKIIDNYGFFNDDMLKSMNMLVEQSSEELEMNICIFIADDSYRMTDYETECFADDTYDKMYGEDSDGVFYFMDFTGEQPAYDYISTSGKAVLFYESCKEDIFDAIAPNLPPSGLGDYSGYSDDITNAVKQFLTQLDYYYNNTNLKYYHDTSSDKYFYYKNNELVISDKPPFVKRLKILIFALPAGLVTALIYFFATKGKYKFKASANPVVYVSHDETKFNQRDDRFIRTYTTKSKIENNSGGSNGNSGGHSSSGGHGGGGRHR